MQPAAFARGVVCTVDRLLNIAARFFQDLAHFAGHFARELVLLCAKDLAEREQKLCATRSRRATPTRGRVLRRLDRAIHVFLGRIGKSPDDICCICRVYVVKVLSRRRLHPFTADVVRIFLDRRIRRSFRFCHFCCSHNKKEVPTQF